MQLYKQPQEKWEEIPNIRDISSDYGQSFLNKLGDLYNQLTGEKLNKPKLFNTVELLNKIRQNQEKTYLKKKELRK